MKIVSILQKTDSTLSFVSFNFQNIFKQLSLLSQKEDKMIVTFCGHRNIDAKNRKALVEWLERILENLLLQGATTFYLGGYGAFDQLANQTLKRLKQRYPTIEHVLILPYLNHKFVTEDYTSSLYPPLETVPKRLAILRRNEWMIAESDIVIAYVWSIGGAKKTLDYAKQKKKQIVCFPN